MKTLDLFRLWLNSKRSAEVVGYACSGCNCPFANYLGSIPGNVMENVRVGGISHDADAWRGTPTINPLWLTKFIDEIDQCDDETFEVTAAHALRVLRRVEAYGE